MQLEQQIRTYATDELLRNMRSHESPESLKSAMKDAIVDGFAEGAG